MNYSYHQYHPQAHRQDPKLAKLKQDNIGLEKALAQLNECYKQKINILECELKKSKKREQDLLEWKSEYIEKELFKNSKYEQQLQKMIKMMEEMSQNYEKQNKDLRGQLMEKQQQISHLKDENNYLRQQRDVQDQKVEKIAKKYIDEIERLNNELKQLKDEVDYEDIMGGNNFSVEDSNEEDEKDHQITNNSHCKKVNIEQQYQHNTHFDLKLNEELQTQPFYSELHVQIPHQIVLKDISNHDSLRNSHLNHSINPIIQKVIFIQRNQSHFIV